MKKGLLILIALSLLSGGYGIAGQKFQEKGTSFINFQVKDIRTLSQHMFSEEKQCHDITFTTTGAWTSTLDETPWISISPDHGNEAGTYTVSITMEINKTGEDRWAGITITCNEEEMTIAISQDRDGTPGCANGIFVFGDDVYIAGYEGDYATLWKNGIAQHLNDGLDDAQAFSVYVSGENVYVAGIEKNYAMLWKNGVGQRLTDGSKRVWIESVFVSGNDVFVSGEEYNGTGKYVAKIWKNGEVQELSNKKIESFASSVFVSGSDMYVAGYEKNEKGNYVAILWKNGEAQYLTDENNNAWARSVYVSENVVYVAGEEQGMAKVWKNGIPEELNLGMAKSIFVSGNDIYVAGYEGGFDKGSAILWKNGFSDNDLINNNFSTYANAVFVAGEDVYVAGEKYGEGPRPIAVFWKNGKMYNLTNENAYNQSKDEDEGYDYEEVYEEDSDYEEDYNEDPEYYMIDKIREYIENDNVKALLEYVTYLTPEQQEETEVDFTFEKRKTVLSNILEMEKFDLFEHFMEDERETKSWASDLLYASAKSGHLEAVKYLISKGADVNIPEANGYTPVIAALENNYMKVVEYLVNHGANLNLMVSDYYPNESYETPLLFKYYYQNRHSANYYDENYKLLRRLIEAGADVNFGYEGDETLLFKAKYEDTKFVTYLINHGANVNAKDSDGKTPLFDTSLEMTKFLINNNADVNATDNYLRTPLFYALNSYEDGLVEYLIEKGAKINLKDNNGYTPLHIAAMENNLVYVKLLVENGANIHVKDNVDHTPIYYTDGSSKAGKEIITYLKSKGADDKDAGIGGLFNIEFSM